jgi:hypothetical protein
MIHASKEPTSPLSGLTRTEVIVPGAGAVPTTSAAAGCVTSSRHRAITASA